MTGEVESGEGVMTMVTWDGLGLARVRKNTGQTGRTSMIINSINVTFIADPGSVASLAQSLTVVPAMLPPRGSVAEGGSAAPKAAAAEGPASGGPEEAGPASGGLSGTKKAF